MIFILNYVNIREYPLKSRETECFPKKTGERKNFILIIIHSAKKIF